jgi:transitional endoplasmic reticulum ATPase
MATREKVAEVRREGTAIAIPESMSYRSALQSIQRRMAYEEEMTEIEEIFDAFPWDGAQALQRAINEQFGWSQAEWIPGGFFQPDQAPQLIAVEVAWQRTVHVPWGRFSLPNINGWIQTGMTKRNHMLVFTLTAHVQRKHESDIKALADRTRELVRADSIYRGKAIKIRFVTDDEDMPPLPTFLNVANATPDRLVFSQHVSDAVATNLYTPVTRLEDLRKHRVPFKRGVLLCGHYGTGKTEIANTTAHLAEEANISFIYVEDATQFAEAIQFAQQYAPAVVFCEDIDRVSEGKRTNELNRILNIIDGIESKSTDVLVVLTTNNVDGIHESMLRPGRMDAVIEIERPDGEAVKGLVRLYAGNLLAESEDLSDIAHTLAGQIPAVIREVVERGKLAAIRLTPADEPLRLTGAALAESARTMHHQIELLERTPPVPLSDIEKAADRLGAHFNKVEVAGNGQRARAL